MTSDANGTYRGVYTYGLERISESDQVSVEGVPNDPLFYLYDGRGSVTQLINTPGTVKDKYRYTPFGVPMPGGQLTPNTRLFNNPYGYNGEDYDIESGLQFLRARYYNPETARFITRDSYLGDVMEPLSLNRYAYTSNNPVMNIDPSGHTSKNLKPTLQKNLTYNANAERLQQMLVTIGYDIGVDGKFGGQTDAAVRDFQNKSKIGVDGVVGNVTWTKLEEVYNNVLSTGITPGKITIPKGSDYVKAKQDLLIPENNVGCGDKEDISSDIQGKGNSGKMYISNFDPGLYNPLLWSSNDQNLPYSLQENILKYSYEYTKAANEDDKKRALTELKYYRKIADDSILIKYYEAKDFINEEDNEKLLDVLLLYSFVRQGGASLKTSSSYQVTGNANGSFKIDLQLFGRKSSNNLKPDSAANGYPHSTFKTDPSTGKVTNYETYKSNPKNPTGLDLEKRYDGIGNPHYNPVTGEDLMPHVHDKLAPGGVRGPRIDEIPR